MLKINSCSLIFALIAKQEMLTNYPKIIQKYCVKKTIMLLFLPNIIKDNKMTDYKKFKSVDTRFLISSVAGNLISSLLLSVIIILIVLPVVIVL